MAASSPGTRRQGPGRLGQLGGLLVSNEKIPDVAQGFADRPFSGQRTSDLGLGIGLSILSGFLDAMSGQHIGLDVQYKSSRTIAFEFQNVKEDRIDIIELDKYLTTADVNTSSRHIAQMLDADQLYVITSTIKSTQFFVEAKDSTAQVSASDLHHPAGGRRECRRFRLRPRERPRSSMRAPTPTHWCSVFKPFNCSTKTGSTEPSGHFRRTSNSRRHVRVGTPKPEFLETQGTFARLTE